MKNIFWRSVFDCSKTYIEFKTYCHIK